MQGPHIQVSFREKEEQMGSHKFIECEVHIFKSFEIKQVQMGSHDSLNSILHLEEWHSA